MKEPKNILIVEDEALVAENLRRTLEDAGYRVPAIARNCADAFELARSIRPHLVLMDIILDDKDCDGIDTQKLIHEQLSIPVIFLTALSEKGIIDKAIESCPYGYLLKPVSDKDLLITIETSMKRHELEEALRLSEEKFRSIYESSPIGIELYDPAGRLLHINGAGLEIFGVTGVDEVRGFNLFEDPNVTGGHKEALRKGGTVRFETLFNFDLVKRERLYTTTKAGVINLDVLITPICGDGQGAFRGYLVHVQDITTRKIYENTLRELSLVDQLTGLYNRRGFLKLAGQHVSISSRTKERLSLVFLDLNGLKKINDTHGHPEGDRALIQAASVLRRTFRNSDVIARWGGDEFAVLMVNAKNGCAESVDERLRDSIMAINGEGLLKAPLSLSWGITRLEPESEMNLEELISLADQEMYRHKRRRD